MVATSVDNFTHNKNYFPDTKKPQLFLLLLLQDSDIPPSERCRYKTTKAPTGPFNRQQLLDFLETKAKDEKDWEDAKPYIKEIRGVR